ncbi:MAG: WD40 repeat domain-containing protein [archaeon]|nr:WD40 repeat domain-containing protein [archaeon]
MEEHLEAILNDPYDSTTYKEEFKSICHNCKRLPRILVLGDRAEKIQLDCPGCSTKTSIATKDFIEEMKDFEYPGRKRDSVANNLQIKCENESCPNKEKGENYSNAYCIVDNKWYCEECINNHKTSDSHHDCLTQTPGSRKFCDSCKKEEEICFYSDNKNLYYCYKCGTEIKDDNLKKYPLDDSEENQRKIKQYLDKTEEHIKYIKNTYDKYIGHLVQKIREIHEEFTINDQLNKNIYSIVKSLYDTYNKDPNYNTYFSMIKIMEFDIEHREFNEDLRFKEIDKSLEEFQKYLKEKTVLKKDRVNYFSDLQNYKEKEKLSLSKYKFNIEAKEKKDAFKKVENEEFEFNPYNIEKLSGDTIAVCGKSRSTNYGLCPILKSEGLDIKDLIIHSTSKEGIIYDILTRKKIVENLTESQMPDLNKEFNYDDIFTCGSEAPASIKIWGWNKKKNAFTVLKELKKAHEKAINKLINLKNNKEKPKFASCSDDGSIKIWDQKKYKCLMKINAHEGLVKSIIEIENAEGKEIIASLGNDGKIKFWDISKSNIPEDQKEPSELQLEDCIGEVNVFNDQNSLGYDEPDYYLNALFFVDKIIEEDIPLPKEKTILCGSNDGHIYVIKFDIGTLKIIKKYGIKNKLFGVEDNYMTGGGVCSFIKLHNDGSILCGCPEGNIVQLVESLKDQNNSNDKEEALVLLDPNDKKEDFDYRYRIISQRNVLGSDIVAFTSICKGKGNEKKYYYAAGFNGDVILFDV